MHNIAIPFITILVAFARHSITQGNMKWYNALKKPFGSPTGFSLVIIWSILFTLAGVSALIVWNLYGDRATITISMLYVINGALNIGWSYIFFVRNYLGFALIEICVLNLTTLMLMYIIWPLSILTALLLLPYVLWTTYATYIVARIWEMNR
jgi:tryptophan-rich sensory protein